MSALVRSVAVLVRTDGECWPDCQDMDLDLTEPDGAWQARGVQFVPGVNGENSTAAVCPLPF